MSEYQNILKSVPVSSLAQILQKLCRHVFSGQTIGQTEKKNILALFIAISSISKLCAYPCVSVSSVL